MIRLDPNGKLSKVRTRYLALFVGCSRSRLPTDEEVFFWLTPPSCPGLWTTEHAIVRATVFGMDQGERCARRACWQGVLRCASLQVAPSFPSGLVWVWRRLHLARSASDSWRIGTSAYSSWLRWRHSCGFGPGAPVAAAQDLARSIVGCRAWLRPCWQSDNPRQRFQHVRSVSTSVLILSP